MQLNAPDWAQDALHDLSDDKVYLVEQEVFADGWTLSGFKLKETGQWHIYQRAIDRLRSQIHERMMYKGMKRGLGRSFYIAGDVYTCCIKQDELAKLPEHMADQRFYKFDNTCTKVVPLMKKDKRANADRK